MPTPPSDPGTTRGPLALKLDLLFRTRLRPVSKAQHARDIAAAGDPNLPPRLVEHSTVAVARAAGSTDAYIHQLRRGQRQNPAIQKLRGIAEFFGVDVAYLADDRIAAERLPEYLLEHDPHSLTSRVNTLFAVFRNGATPFTSEEVAEAIGVDVEQLRQLREGNHPDPGLRLLQSLATFFGVNGAYLTSSDAEEIARIQRQIDVVSAGLPIAARGTRSQPLMDGQTVELLRAIVRMVKGFEETSAERPTADPSRD